MTDQENQIFLLSSTLLCAIMAIFNLVRFRKRGISAYFLSSAFLVMGGVIYLFRTNAPSLAIEGSAVVLLLLLGADFIIRVGNAPKRKP